MEQKIIEAANKYRENAIKLKDFDEQHVLSESIPEQAGLGLLKLYFALSLNAGIQKCEELLDEDSDEETVNAVADAARAAEDAADDAFTSVWMQVSRDKEFSQTVEGITEESSVDGPHTLLIKLFKCEGIIREAYRRTSNFPLYGAIGSMSKPQSDFDVVTNQEDYIYEKTGIDIYRLLEVKQTLIEDIERLIGGTESIEKNESANRIERLKSGEDI